MCNCLSPLSLPGEPILACFPGRREGVGRKHHACLRQGDCIRAKQIAKYAIRHRACLDGVVLGDCVSRKGNITRDFKSHVFFYPN